MRNEKSPKRDLLSKNTDGMTKRSDWENGEDGEGASEGERVVVAYSRGAEKRETRERSVRRKREK